MTKTILPGMIIVDKGTDMIHHVIAVCTQDVHVISLVKLTHNQYKIAGHVKFTKDYFQFVVNHRAIKI